jgi:pyruvate dehydrogenase E1 component beta subunit
MTIRTTYGAGIRAAAHHSECLYAIFTHIPGLKVAIPSSPYEAKGLLVRAIRDDDPVIFFENKVMYGVEGDVPEELYSIPFGEAEIVREGSDVTVVALGRMVHLAAQAANALADEGIEVELIDPRTTSPLDEDTILESVENTGRIVVVDESGPRCGMAADIVALVTTNAWSDLKAPPRMVTPPHTPVPFSPILEDAYVPTPEGIAAAIRETTGAPAHA